MKNDYNNSILVHRTQYGIKSYNIRKKNYEAISNSGFASKKVMPYKGLGCIRDSNYIKNLKESEKTNDFEVKKIYTKNERREYFLKNKEKSLNKNEINIDKNNKTIKEKHNTHIIGQFYNHNNFNNNYSLKNNIVK